jgi:predicted ribosomally synthesized peptide with SipW-like signal peptide
MTAKKKLFGALGGVAALGATVALTAGTFSYFSDSATVNGGSADISYGKLTLKLGDEAPAAQPVQAKRVAPGQVIFDKDLSFINTGTMAGQLRIGFVENQSNTDAFSHAVQITLSGAGLPDGTYRLDELAAKTTTDHGIPVYTIPASGDRTKGIHMTVTVDPQAGNELQGASGGFTLQADLRQSNNDGRGDSDGQDQSFPATPAPQQP